jgi:hypothetical protein
MGLVLRSRSLAVTVWTLGWFAAGYVIGVAIVEQSRLRGLHDLLSEGHRAEVVGSGDGRCEQQRRDCMVHERRDAVVVLTQ